MNIKKRRVYEITNVLEGIGIIEKTSKNHMGLVDPKFVIKEEIVLPKDEDNDFF